MKTFRIMLTLAGLACGMAASAVNKDIVITGAYKWIGDSIIQDEFKAYSVSPTEIVSNYKGRPGYKMPVEQRWTLKNDISSYPVLTADNKLLQAIYNMGLDEMINAVEPDTTLRTGKEWAGVWTRDVSYSIILSMAALQPEAAMISLMKKVNPSGQIIQDTGSGGAWPVSTDRMIWIVAAYEVYKVTGDKEWLRKVYPIAIRSIEKDEKTIYSDRGLVKGETSFIDWREQSYPKWMQTVDISQSEAFGTNALYVAALKATAAMAEELGQKKEGAQLMDKARNLAENVNKYFWIPEKGYYGMYTYGRENKILNPRAEALGHAIAILYDVIPADKIEKVSESLPITPYGPPVFFPQISDMPNYHNNALWPFVAAYWTLAQAKAGNEKAVEQGIGSLIRPAALFATNKENLNLDNGDYFTELNSSNMLWSLSGNLAITQRILMGINFEKDGLRFQPFVSESLADTRILEKFPYRGAEISIKVAGFGSKVKSLKLNGKSLDPEAVIPASLLKKGGRIEIEMDNMSPEKIGCNMIENVKAPLTPIVRFETPGADVLTWNPIEYIAGYKVLKNGEEVGFTRSTTWNCNGEGEWQVIGVDDKGVESFASEPLSNRNTIIVEMPGETTEMISEELSYKPQSPVKGFRGAGFRELSQSGVPLQIEVETPSEGLYSLYFRYANGNGPVNTENKCAIRTLYVNGKKAGTVVLPQRGVANWDDWGETNCIGVVLPVGKSMVELRYEPEDENMNIVVNHAIVDRLVLERK